MEIKTCAALDCDNQFESTVHNRKYCSLECKQSMRNFVKGVSQIELHVPVEDEEDESWINSPPETSMLLPPPSSSSLSDARKFEFLRKENMRLTALVNKHKDMAKEMQEAVYRAMSENLQQITVKPPKDFARSYSEDMVINPTNSDTQLGKRTPTYDSQVAAERVELYTDRIIQHTLDFRNSYSIRKAHVWFLGDIVEGEGIFPTQPHVIDSSLYAQVAKNGPAIYAAQLRRLLEVFDEVEVVAVIGNHGRLSKFHNPESNMDRMLYKILEHIFAHEPRIKFHIPDGHGESMFWAVDAIGNYSTLLIHGDQLPPPTSGATYHRRIMSWKSGGIPVHFNDVIMGHYHQNTKMTINQTVVRVSGSTESTNTFAQERLAVMGRPSQHLQLISPVHGVIWESDVHLDQ